MEKLRVAAVLAALAGTLAITCAPAWAQATDGNLGAPSASWTWPPIPGCLSDPEIKTGGSTDYASAVCSVYDALLASGADEVELRSARKLNGELDGVLYPAFLPGTEVVIFTVNANVARAFRGADGLVRVSTRSVTARSGSWWTTRSAVTQGGQLLSADQIRAKLALIDTPACIASAETLRSGVRAYMGVVAPAFNEPGGGVEFWFPPDAVIAGAVASIPLGPGCDTR